jgi:hypothetical protein
MMLMAPCSGANFQVYSHAVCQAERLAWNVSLGTSRNISLGMSLLEAPNRQPAANVYKYHGAKKWFFRAIFQRVTKTPGKTLC